MGIFCLENKTGLSVQGKLRESEREREKDKERERKEYVLGRVQDKEKERDKRENSEKFA